MEDPLPSLAAEGRAPRRPGPHVLVIAEHANPEWVSIPLEGWSLTAALARQVPVHLVTQIRNREAIRKAGWIEGRDFTAIDSEAAARTVWALGSALRGGSEKGWTTVTALQSLNNYYFEHLVWRRFSRRLRDGEFDLVHRVTPPSPTVASLMSARCRDVGVPFLLGPLNGGVPWPRQFDATRRKEREWLSYLRPVHKLLPAYRSTRHRSSAILIGSRDTWAQMPRACRDRCFYVPENGIDPSRFTVRRTRRAQAPLRTAFVGRLVPYKGADMLLEAAAPLVRGGKLTVTILGDGPQRPELEEFIRREGVGGGVRLAGWVEHTEVQNHLIQADLFVFPSIREFGGAVVLEAMAVGLAPVVVDYGGPAELVTPRTGYLVPLGSRAEIVGRLRAALSALAESPAEIDVKSRCALRRAHELFTWRAKSERVVEVYDWVLGRGRRPDSPMPLPDPADGADAGPRP